MTSDKQFVKEARDSGRDGLFDKDRPIKSKRRAEIIKIDSPKNFRKSIKDLQKDGFSKDDRQALVFAQNRATAQLNRKTLSKKERRQFEEISRIRIPKVKTKSKR